jgi:hypothetical protein
MGCNGFIAVSKKSHNGWNYQLMDYPIIRAIGASSLDNDCTISNFDSFAIWHNQTQVIAFVCLKPEAPNPDGMLKITAFSVAYTSEAVRLSDSFFNRKKIEL